MHWCRLVQRSLALCNKDQRAKWILLDALTTTIGAGFSMVAMPFLLIGLSGRALDFGIASFLEALPSLLILLLCPNFLDKTKPLVVLFVCRCLFVLINLAIAGLIYFDAVTANRLFAMALLGGVVWGVAYPATQAVMPLYVRKQLIGLINSVLSAATSSAVALMPIVAGYLILSDSDNFGLSVAFAIDAVFIVCSLVFLLRLSRCKTQQNLSQNESQNELQVESQTEVENNGKGLYISGFVLVFVSLFLVYGPVITYLPIYIVKANSVDHFTIYLSQLVGAVVASLVSARVMVQMDALLQHLLRFWLLAAVALLLFALTDHLLVHFVLFTVLSFCSYQHGLKVLSWLQSYIPISRMGKTMTYYASLVLMIPPVAALLIGMAVDRFDLRSVVMVNGLLVMLCFVLTTILLKNQHRLA
jgi:predicted MFS family arabinose efflux permease